MIVCMFLSLSHCALDIFTNGKCINQGVKYRLEFCANFPFYGTEKAIKLAKNEIKKFEENLNETVKHCLKYNVYKLFTVNVLYDLLLIVSGVKKSVIGGNVNWDLKMKSTTERCLLVCAKERFCYGNLTLILSFPGKSVRCREVSGINDVHYKEVSPYYI